MNKILYRMINGGSWYLNYNYCRSAKWYRLNPGNWNYHFGFRVAFRKKV